MGGFGYILVIVLALVLASCGDDDVGDDETATTTTQAASTEVPSDAMAVTTANSDLGAILTDGSGNALYVFIPDGQGPSVCYDDCETAWPPLVGDATAGEGIDASLLGSEARNDGSEQTTYDGWPLYYFAADGAPGDINGQGVNDVWFVVAPDGQVIGFES
jgi:predicted lipoprotein with Yx(FWY)xxD motif